MSHQTKPLKSVSWVLKPVLWHRDNTSPSNLQHRASQLFPHAQDGLAGLLAQLISGLEKWTVWSSRLCFHLSQVRLGSLLTAVKTGALILWSCAYISLLCFAQSKTRKICGPALPSQTRDLSSSVVSFVSSGHLEEVFVCF